MAAFCSPGKEGQDVVFVTLDPGHFHAAMVSKMPEYQMNEAGELREWLCVEALS